LENASLNTKDPATERLYDYVQETFPRPNQHLAATLAAPMDTTVQPVNNLESAFERLCLASYANKLPTFSGERMGAGFMDFLDKFNEIGNIMGLNESKMVRLLPAHLSGTAKAVFENLTDEDKLDWRKAVTKLKDHFSTDQFLDMAREKIMNMRMDAGESPVVFSNRIRKEIMDAYPNNNLIEQRKFLQHMVFSNGLPYKIKEKLKLLGPLSNNYESLLRDAERMHDITRTNSLPEGDMLIAKIDRAIDEIVSKRVPTASHFRKPLRNYNPNYAPKQYNNLITIKTIIKITRALEVHHVIGEQSPYFQGTQNRSNNSSYNRNQGRSYERPNSPFRQQNSSFRQQNSPYRQQNSSFNQPNFSNRRTNSPFRRQQNAPFRQQHSRSRYPVNSIIPGSPKTLFNPMTSLFVIAIISMFITPTSAFSLKYQVCAAGKSGWPIAFPDPVQCTSSPNSSEVLITGAELYVERTEPLLLSAYHCFNKTRRICASSYLHSIVTKNL
ncbi:hypothetical protein OSTOST_06078, partial [Ostertagia ostertagi]